jgi:nitrate reductase beta subunit
MPTRTADEATARVAQAYLEWAYLDEYLKGMGYSLEDLQTMPAERAKALMRDASLFASMRMSEVEARSNLMEELHGGPKPM